MRKPCVYLQCVYWMVISSVCIGWSSPVCVLDGHLQCVYWMVSSSVCIGWKCSSVAMVTAVLWVGPCHSGPWHPCRYNGDMMEEHNKSQATYVLTDKEAPPTPSPGMDCIQAEWVWDCLRQRQILSTEKYIVH